MSNYYSSLRPFQDTFRKGLPILTYHHVGPRPRGARLRGLYVSPELFNRQMGELRDAGFSSGSLDALARGEEPPPPRVVVTFDDGFRDVFLHALPGLADSGLRAIQFLVAERIGGTNEWQQQAGDVREPLMNEAQVHAWLAGGHEIGSHTLTHPWLTRIPVAQAREEISSSRKALEDRFGVAVRHFCYPYGDVNEVIRELVGEAGYATACTTRTGINPAGCDPLMLQRFTARYPSRKLKAMWQRLVQRFGSKSQLWTIS